MRVVVKPRVRPVHAGTVYEPGDVVELPMSVACSWIANCWAVAFEQVYAPFGL